MKNRFGYHQEVVSRILKRPVNYGAVEKFRGNTGGSVNHYPISASMKG